MTTKSLIALAFICLAPLAALAETAPAATPPAAPSAATATPGATAAKPEYGPGSKRWEQCSADVAKFCANLEKGKGVIRACLESHAASISPACKTSMAEHAAHARDKAAQ